MIIRLTHEVTEYISALFLLISTSTLTGVDQDAIHDAKHNNDGNTKMYDDNKSKLGHYTEKEYVYEVLDYY